MAVITSPASRVLCASFCVFAIAEGSYDNEGGANSTSHHVGWHTGPSERGTMTIIWTCLTTILACTWTILHLNVPGRRDGARMKLWRKAKWMAITVIFPEFIFSKAVCELQMAVEDLHDLKLQEEAFGWKVEYGRGCRLLYKLFQFRLWRSASPDVSCAAAAKVFADSADERATARIPETEIPLTNQTVAQNAPRTAGEIELIEPKVQARWTLTHSYFANMGGLVSQMPGWSYEPPLTAHELNDSLHKGHNPLHRDFRLSEQDILDKSKADAFGKSVATLQIATLLLSVLTRVARRLPVSQLEVCTVAFAVLGAATYAANLAKPKDVEVPVSMPEQSWHRDFEPETLWGISFSQRLMNLAYERTLYKRIWNDALRPQLPDSQFITLSYALALSTAGFGAIHCAAWRADFPTQWEKVLWLILSILSATLPLFNLFVTAWTNHLFPRASHKLRDTIVRTAMGDVTYDYSGKNVLFWKDGELWSCKETPADELHNELLFAKDSLSLVAGVFGHRLDLILSGSFSDVDISMFWHSWKQWDGIFSKLRHKGYLFTDTPANLEPFARFLDHRSDSITRTGITDAEWHSMLKFFVHSDELEKEWDEYCTSNIVLRAISAGSTLVSGCLYGIARVTILGLAFAALRKQDMGLYTDTWTRHLPSIG